VTRFQRRQFALFLLHVFLLLNIMYSRPFRHEVPNRRRPRFIPDRRLGSIASRDPHSLHLDTSLKRSYAKWNLISTRNARSSPLLAHLSVQRLLFPLFLRDGGVLVQPPVRVCKFEAAETYCEGDAAAEYLLSLACYVRNRSAHIDLRTPASARVPIR
jgi:hypothetical protein